MTRVGVWKSNGCSGQGEAGNSRAVVKMVEVEAIARWRISSCGGGTINLPFDYIGEDREREMKFEKGKHTGAARGEVSLLLVRLPQERCACPGACCFLLALR
jgi:hypothetical protein